MADLENKDLMQEQEKPEGEEQQEQDNTPSINDLMTQIAELRAANAKQKNALDKALKNNGDLTKQLRAKMTAEEVETEEKQKAKEEHEAYVRGLEMKIAIGNATERYTALGMDVVMARETAEFDVKGDKESVSKNLMKFLDARDKAKEAEWIKSRPQPQAGGEDSAGEDPFLKGFNSVKIY